MLTSVPVDCTDHPVKAPPHLILAGIVVHGNFYQTYLMIAEHGCSRMWVDFLNHIRLASHDHRR